MPVNPMPSNSLISWEENNGFVILKFVTQNNVDALRCNHWSYSVFQNLKDLVAERDILIKDNAPVEAYAALGFCLVQFGARTIHCTEYNLHEDILIYDSNENAHGGSLSAPWFKSSSNHTADLLEITPAPTPDGRWNNETIRQLAHIPKLARKNSESVILSGRGPVIMYATLGCLAAKTGYTSLLIDKPVLPYYYSFSIAKTPICSLIIKSNDAKTKGWCLGILGDPNSGKSVFSKTLFHCVRDKFSPNSAWIYDCDIASPTPEWYFHGQSASNEALKNEYELRRKQLKSQWDTKKETKVSVDLQNIKHNLQFVVADLPGGNHKAIPPQRIPGPTRANIMRQCNALIVLCREDKPNVFEDWIVALKEYGLEHRVVAKIITRCPTAPVAVSGITSESSGLLSCTVTGLDRTKTDDKLIDALQKTLQDLLEKIQRVLPLKTE